jgi:hypothetical protein
MEELLEAVCSPCWGYVARVVQVTYLVAVMSQLQWGIDRVGATSELRDSCSGKSVMSWELQFRELWGSCQPVMTWAEEDIVGIRYQAMAGEDIEDLVWAVVGSQVCELARAL